MIQYSKCFRLNRGGDYRMARRSLSSGRAWRGPFGGP
jgi:hypothetical protein